MTAVGRYVETRTDYLTLSNLRVKIPNLIFPNANNIYRLESLYKTYKWVLLQVDMTGELYPEMPYLFTPAVILRAEHVKQLSRQSALSEEQTALLAALILKGIIK